MQEVISKIEKEFIFKFLEHNKIKVEVKEQKSSTYAYIIEFNSKEIKLELFSQIEDIQPFISEITIIFYFQNNFHQFKSKILRIQKNILIVTNPENIAKNLQRKFKRMLINGKLNFNFIIKGDLIKLDYPQSSVYYFPNKSPIEADFFDIDINKILKKFNDKISTLVSANKIRMLRNYRPSSFEELLVIKSGKILYISDIHTELPQKQIDPNLSIILKSEWVDYEILKNKTQAYLVNKALSNYLKSLSQSDIFSEAIVPILYRNYVIGLIYLINNHQSSKPISIKILNYSHQFARLLSYMLKENGYFKEEEKNTQRYNSPIYDLSGGGLAFMHTDNFYEDKLLLDHNVNIVLELNNKHIRIYAKVARKFKQEDKYFYGFMFIDIKKQDFDFLNRYLSEFGSEN